MRVGTKMQKEFYQVYKPSFIERPQKVRPFISAKKTAPLLGVCFAALCIYGAHAANIRFSNSDQGNSRTVTFSWAEAANYTHEIDGDELIIRFSNCDEIKMVDAQKMEAAAKAAGDSIGYGYDSFYFKPAPGMDMEVEKGAKGIKIKLTKGKSSPDIVASKEKSTQLKLIQARIALEKGEFKDAFKILDGLYDEDPKNIQVLQARAGAEFSIGRWEEAYRHITEAEAQEKLNEDIQLIKNAIEDAYGPSVGGNFEYKKVGTTKIEQIGRLNARVKIFPGTFIGGQTEVNRFKLEGITRSRTGLPQVVKSTIHRDEIYAEHNFDNGNQLKASYFASNGHSGGGAVIKVNDYNGHFVFSGEYNKADWGNNESLVDRGVRHQLRAGRHQQITPHFFAKLEGNANWYDINGTNNAARSLGWMGLLSYTIPAPKLKKILGCTGSATIAYNVEAQYPTNTKRIVGATGATFKPLPLKYQEVHGLEVSATADPTSWLNLYGFAGYSFDRYGGSGPRAGARATLKPVDNLQLSAEVTSSVSNTNSTEREDRAVLGAKWVF